MTGFYQFLEYKPGKPFAWFPAEVAVARRQADKNPNKRIVGDPPSLEGKESNERSSSST